MVWCGRACHRYHPWRALRSLPPLTLCGSAAVTRGRVDGHTSSLYPLPTQAERRSTLAHELVHLEREQPPPHLTDYEELIVEEIAARRIADAILWHDGNAHDDLADDLWVDRAILVARIRALDHEDRAYIERIVARREGSA